MLESTSCQSHKRKGQAAAAFTITELMVAVSLMTLIVYALYSMFNQTQRALRSNEAQVDSTERGRGVLELVSREMESARVGLRADTTNLWLRTPGNVPTLAQKDAITGDPAAALPMRTNRFDDVYYLTKSDKAWRGVGYIVLQSTNIPTKGEALDRPGGGLGTLYRYETPLTNRDYAFPSTNLFSGFVKSLPAPNTTLWSTNATNFSQISQGIVHFRVLPYDTKGQLMAFYTTNLDSEYRMVRTGPLGVLKYPLSNIPQNYITNATVLIGQGSQADPLSTSTTFRSNALPAYLELELGVLEPDALRTYNQMIKDEQGPQARAFLERRIAKVQIFRKRIPLRTVAQ
jgi:type II secretory pathway pseudopilin PulG